MAMQHPEPPESRGLAPGRNTAMARCSVAAPHGSCVPEKRASKQPQEQHPFRAAGLQEPVCVVQNRRGRSGASLSPCRSASDRPAREMSSGCRAECGSQRGTRSQPGGDQNWECGIRRSVALLGSVCMHVRNTSGGRWVAVPAGSPSPALSAAGASPLQKPAALLPSFAAEMGPALGIRAAVTSSSIARMLQMK